MKMIVHVQTNRVVGCHMVSAPPPLGCASPGNWGLRDAAGRGMRSTPGSSPRRLPRLLHHQGSAVAAARLRTPPHPASVLPPQAPGPGCPASSAAQVGPDAAEIMQGLGVALKCNATKAQFDSCVGIHPSAAEEWVTMSSPARWVARQPGRASWPPARHGNRRQPSCVAWAMHGGLQRSTAQPSNQRLECPAACRLATPPSTC